MCGIIGYTGKQEALTLLLRGLRALSYRGYDSTGLSMGGSPIVTVKSKGKIDDLEKN